MVCQLLEAKTGQIAQCGDQLEKYVTENQALKQQYHSTQTELQSKTNEYEATLAAFEEKLKILSDANVAG